MSCIEISDLRFRSYLYCISMIFAFLGLPACPSTPSTAVQPLCHRVTAQREPWPRGTHPTGFSAACAWATHLEHMDHCTLPVSHTSHHACTKAGQSKSDASLYLHPEAYGTIQTQPMCILRATCSLYPYTLTERGRGANNMQGSPFCQASPVSLTGYKGKLLFKN